MSEIRVNTIVNAESTAAPNLPYGIQIPTGMGITGAGGVNIQVLLLLQVLVVMDLHYLVLEKLLT